MTLQKRVERAIQSGRRANANAGASANANGGANANANANANVNANGGANANANGTLGLTNNDNPTFLNRLRALPERLGGLRFLGGVIVFLSVLATLWILFRHSRQDMELGTQIYEKTKKLEQHYRQLRKDFTAIAEDPYAKKVCDESMQLQQNMDAVWGLKILPENLTAGDLGLNNGTDMDVNL